MGRLSTTSGDKNGGTRSADSQSDLLISQLDTVYRPFASFAHVIIHASEMMTRGSGKNDFTHSEAVHRRLSELLPNARQFPLSEAEIFILIASAYLHDVGHPNTGENRRHGEIAAGMISSCNSMKWLFPGGDIQNQVAKLCEYHDREIKDLKELEDVLNLDVRPCSCFTIGKMSVHPRMLAAIFRLADELECNSDRMLGQSTVDPRTIIAGVRIDLEPRSICLDFKYGVPEQKRGSCLEYLRTRVQMLNTFLSPYGFSFQVVDKLPEKDLIAAEEGVDTQRHSATAQETVDFDELAKMYHELRMDRVDSVLSVLPERGRRK